MLNTPQDLPQIDDEIARQPEDIRRDLAEAASRDLFLFNKGVLGYRDLTSFHQQLCSWHDTNAKQFKETLVARGHLKTSCITIGKNLQRITRDAESRTLIANETATNAQRFLSAIKAHAESNKRFRALYSHLIPTDTRKGSWSSEELTFRREGIYTVPTFDTIGMTGAVTSRHYTHISIDDPISQEAAKSALVMQDVIDRISNLMSLMNDPGIDTVDLTGTRWAFWDVYAWFEKTYKERLGRFIMGDMKDGKPVWPERFTPEVLAQIRASLGEYLYSCQYRNNPRNVALQDFNVQDLKFWTPSADEDSVVLLSRSGEIERIVELADLDITVTVDVRYGDKLTSDRDAVVVCGTTQGGDAIVLSTWAERSNPLAVIAELIRVIKRYQPRCIGIQKVGYEMSLKYHLKAECEREGVYANVVPVRPGGPGKTHIRGLQPVAATGHLYLLPTQLVLRTELAEYPLGQFDDVADALALQTQLWRGLLSPERLRRYKESENRILRGLVDYGSDRAQVVGLLKAGELEDIGYDPEMDRYGAIYEIQVID